MKEVVTYHDNGVVKERYTINENGNIDGLYESFNDAGKKEKVYNYKDGKPDGLCEEFCNTSGLKEKEYIFKNGIKISEKNWYENGQLSKVKIYDENGNLQKLTYYRVNGQKEKEYIYRDKDTITIIDYYVDGQKRLEENRIKGERHGPYKFWHDNGQLALECNYINGKIVGTYVSYHKNGLIKERCTYDENGNIQGLYESFDSNGHKESEYMYKDDEKHGIGRIYFKTYYTEYYYNMGREDPLNRDFNYDGTLIDISISLRYAITNSEKLVFVVDDAIFSKDEYITAYNAGSEEFRKKEVKWFKTKTAAKEYIKENIEKIKKEGYKKKLENILEF